LKERADNPAEAGRGPFPGGSAGENEVARSFGNPRGASVCEGSFGNPHANDRRPRPRPRPRPRRVRRPPRADDAAKRSTRAGFIVID
jgi:hypothetical protein